jgi:hypothetical protein
MSGHNCITVQPGGKQEAHEIFFWGRAQADALDLEAMAKRRLADEYDAAQERGEVKTRADNHSNSIVEFEKASISDIGLTHKEIHDARQIRDAEVEDPGIVRRTLEQSRDCAAGGGW